MKLRALLHLPVCLLILVLLVLWLVPAACVGFEERVCTPALGWCIAVMGKRGWAVGLLLIIPSAALLLLAALAFGIGGLSVPLRDAMEKLNHS